MKVMKTVWFPIKNSNMVVGIVVALTANLNAYIGIGKGGNEEDDIANIINQGIKIRPSQLRDILKFLESEKGCRDLSQQKIDLMNEGKALAEQCGVFVAKLEAHADTDK